MSWMSWAILLLNHLLLALLLFTSSVHAAPQLGIRILSRPEIRSSEAVELIKTRLKVPRAYLLAQTLNDISPFMDSGMPLNLYLEDPSNVFKLGSGNTLDWLQSLLPENPATSLNITTITFGRDMFTRTSKAKRTLSTIDGITTACNKLGLKGVAVTTTLPFDMITTAFPPSAAKFKPEFASKVKLLLTKLNATGAPFQVELMPHDLLKAKAVKGADLKFAMFEVNPQTDMALIDPGTGARYGNLFDMMLDSVFSALEKAGYGDMPVEVASTGWPCSNRYGTFNPPEVSNLIAGEYVGRLLTLLNSRNGTPMRPNGPGPVSVYFHRLIDEVIGDFLQYGFVTSYSLAYKFRVEWDGNYSRIQRRIRT